MVKLICAGYPKTGTKSLSKALTILGYHNIYDYLEHVDYFMGDYLKCFSGEKPVSHILDLYEKHDVECTVDMPPCFFFEDFYKRWPKAKVILTMRDEEEWFPSIKKMNDTLTSGSGWMTYLSRKAYLFQLFSRSLYQFMFGSGSENPWLWKMHYRRHNAYVQEVIPKDNLLIYNVKQGWKPLCNFLGKPIPNEKFPYENAHGSKGNILERLLNESKTARHAKKEIAVVAISLCSALAVILLRYRNDIPPVKIFNLTY